MRELPGSLRSLRRSMQLGYRAEPLLLVATFVVRLTPPALGALSALWIKVLADGVLQRRSGPVYVACFGLGASAGVGWMLREVGNRVWLRFRDRATIEIEAHVARLQATVAGIEHHERPAYLDRLQMLRDHHVMLLNHIHGSFITAIGSVVRLVITLGLLVSIHPALAFLAVFAVVPLLVAPWRAGIEQRVRESSASRQRLARHFYDLGTTSGPAKELRVSGVASRIAQRRREAWDEWHAAMSAARWAGGFWQGAAWAVFGIGYAGAIAFVVSVMRAEPGAVLLAVAAGANLSHSLSGTVSETSFLRMTLDVARRLVWLEDYVAERAQSADADVPLRIDRGVRFDGVSFRYPAGDRDALTGIDLKLPAGSVVAFVGENGAGKTTLVKLLCKFYEPTQGRVWVDDVDLARLPADGWRERLSGAFQDYFRFEYRAGRSVGVGELPRMDDAPAVRHAVERAGAVDVIDRLPGGLETQLGPTWRDGVELSIGQWQKLALARGFMRREPLLCVLDEPTASLDAETEHALFERFAAQARAQRSNGGIAILVSHRFSTVRMADLIVVVDEGEIVEVGSHTELMESRGLYAELYTIQASAYR